MIPIESHPDVPLINHLLAVANRCEKILLERKLEINHLPKSVLIMLAYIAGSIHDIGKATKYFQHYLKTKEVLGNKDHSLISAFFGFFIAQKWLEEQDDIEEELRVLLASLLFVAIKRHHGNLTDFSSELGTLKDKKVKLLEQIDNFYQKETTQIVNNVLKPKGLKFDWKEFVDFLKSDDTYYELQDYVEEYTTQNPPNKLTGIRNFYIYQILYATLLQADKSDVILEKVIRGDKKVDFDSVEKYRETKKWNNPTKDIDKEKNKAYKNGLKQLDICFNPLQHLYSVTLPTGLGKTVTSFALAIQMKKLIGNPAARIIITIPFTSIIDQNYEVYNDILNKPSSSVILKHHHLSEPKYKEGEDDVKNLDESKFLIESWQSQVVVTTFVQLFECLFTNDKSKLLKLPNLTNAIIILDEVQNIPFRLWETIRETFFFLAKQFNCYFILMSATQPLIFEPKKEIIELIPNYKDYFNFFNRTKLVNKTQKIIPLDGFVTDVLNYHVKHPKKSILIILNKVETTRGCFEKIVEKISEEDANLYYLSSQITPYERKIIIKRIKKFENGKPNIIVSTQLIEAGVDISVHTVFRAFAPLDSIIQAAGRANRYWEYKPIISEVFIYKIEELEATNKLIYGGVLLSTTAKVLRGLTEIEETHYLTLIEKYFCLLKKESKNVKKALIGFMQILAFDEVGKFKWIEERDTESVFVQLNDDAVEVWEKYKQLYSVEMKSYERRKLFAQFKATFYDYVVNVPVKYGQLNIHFDSEPELHFYVSKKEKPSINYPFSFNELDFRNSLGYIPIKQISAHF